MKIYENLTKNISTHFKNNHAKQTISTGTPPPKKIDNLTDKVKVERR